MQEIRLSCEALLGSGCRLELVAGLTSLAMVVSPRRRERWGMRAGVCYTGRERGRGGKEREREERKIYRKQRERVCVWSAAMGLWWSPSEGRGGGISSVHDAPHRTISSRSPDVYIDINTVASYLDTVRITP